MLDLRGVLSHYFNCTDSIELYYREKAKLSNNNNKTQQQLLIRLQESTKLWQQNFRTACAVEIEASGVSYTTLKSSYEKCANYMYIPGLHPNQKDEPQISIPEGQIIKWKSTLVLFKIRIQILNWQRFCCPPRLNFWVYSDHLMSDPSCHSSCLHLIWEKKMASVGCLHGPPLAKQPR